MNTSRRNRAALFLDRDGVLLNVERGKYIHNAEEAKWIDGSIEAVKMLAKLNIVILVVTNQQGVGLGLVEYNDVVNIHNKINRDVVYSIDKFYFCPHTKDFGCHCRKPRTAMLEKAINEFSINPHKSIMVGDTMSDTIAAKIVGIMPIHVKSGLEKEPLPGTTSFDCLMDATDFISSWFITLEGW